MWMKVGWRLWKVYLRQSSFDGLNQTVVPSYVVNISTEEGGQALESAFQGQILAPGQHIKNWRHCQQKSI